MGGEVGTFYVDFVLWNQERNASRSVNALVDTGASMTQVPASILEELGVEREYSERFLLADGSRRELSVGEARIELLGKFRIVSVVFGLEGSSVLLGALALETLALAADVRNQRLIQADLTL
jgi:clan AA aspartic protease